MLPNSKPAAALSGIAKEATIQWRRNRGKTPLPTVYVVGVPGYYLNTMGDPARNDRGIYDDAMFLVTPTTFTSFNANTDPSVRFRRGMATLLPGVYPYRPGNHGISRPGGGYPAFRPATKNEELPVKRDGEDAVPSKRPGVAINIHKGSRNGTSSEGCQTIPPSQWDSFHALVTSEMKRHGVKIFEYILLDSPA